jgi:rod shape determining protein RodA
VYFLDRRLVKNFEFGILGGVVLITVLGLVNLYGSTVPTYTGGVFSFFGKQLIWLLISILSMVLVVCINYHTLVYYAHYIHLFSLSLLCLVVFMGGVSSGAQRWIELGPLSLQPSELAKITLLLSLTKTFSGCFGEGDPGRSMLKSIFVFVPTVALVFIQPDLGTSIVLLFLFFSVLFFANVPLRRLMWLPATLILVAPLLWFGLKDYQKERVLTFINPDRGLLSTGYHINQSKIAIGSGRFWGKGFGGGTQGRLRFLPEQHTDFAFSSWSEQSGFLGAVFLVVIYFFVISGCLKVAFRAKDREGFCLVMGVCALIFLQTIINVGMTVGVLPVVGITLPFFSYGGSSLLTCMVLVGLVFNVSLKRFV